MAVKNRLKVILAEKNISQNELAEKIGLSKGALSNIINSKQNATLETAIDIAMALNVSVSDIFYKEKTEEENIIEEFKTLVEQMNGIYFLYEKNIFTRKDIRDIYKRMKENFESKFSDPAMISVCMDVCEKEIENLNAVALEILYNS